MNNIYNNIITNGGLALIIITALVVFASTVPALYKQQKRYKSLKHAPTSKRLLALASLLLIISSLAYSTRAYETSYTNEIAVVIGNTQNTPSPRIEGIVADEIKKVMLKNNGLKPEELTKKIIFISASGNPTLIKFDPATIKLQSLGQNRKIADSIANNNIKAINEFIKNQKPANQGANYYEAILLAKNNINVGAKIIVIGSGLSDTGALNFSKTPILTDKNYRENKLDDFNNEDNDLEGYSVILFGLGDTNKPQEPLKENNKKIVREIYKKVLSALGARVEINTSTLSGPSTETTYVVGLTDTGCGDAGFVFPNDAIKFIPDQANFLNPEVASKELQSVKISYDKSTSTVQGIQVDGFIANVNGADTYNLSQMRADTVKKELVKLGIPESIITAVGRGIGPNTNQEDNRYVKITISRNKEECR